MSLAFNLSLHECPEKVIIIFIQERFAKFWILYHQFLSKVVKLIFAVKEEKILEGFWREKRIVKQKVQLFHSFRQVFVNVHHSLIMKSDGIVTIHVDALRNTSDSSLSIFVLILKELDCSL